MNRSVLTALALVLSSSSALAADELARAKTILAERRQQECRMARKSASPAEKADAQRKFMELNNQLAPIKVAVSNDSALQVEYLKLERSVGAQPCTDAASQADAQAAAADASRLPEALRAQICRARKETNQSAQGAALVEAANLRKQIKAASAALTNAGDKKGAAALDAATREVEMSPKCP